MFTLCPATWLRIRCSVNSGTTTSWAKIPGCIRSSMRQVVRPASGSPNSIAHISPRPAHVLRRPRSARPAGASARAGARRAGRDASTSCRSSSSRSVASPATIAEVVRRERRAVAERVLERVEDGLVDGVAHQQRADRHVAAGERLRDRDQVGLETPVLGREHAARAAEAGLHLVEAEERAVAPAERLRPREVAVRGQDHALAEDRLDDEDRDVLPPELGLERVEVVERHARDRREVAARSGR